MKLGAFSVSLSVKDIAASQAFYEKLGFVVFGGNASHNWLMMRNGDSVIGLFQGMFEKNTLTFNPGWDSECRTLEGFDDVRKIQQALEEAGLAIVKRADPSTSGPAHCVVVDPDGNPILIDQHV
ncbi:MAG: VOC family protein [Isosphaeraceae bacterium]|nr:VOC family protein [Isosphaeraceae bacterium]